jgi:CRISPR-associated protein Csm3
MKENNRKLFGKIELAGELECLTGLHIGASKENMEIGALDSPVVRDPITQEPYIPGSSLKGKMRSLLEKAHPGLLPQRQGGTEKNPVYRHECDSWDFKDISKGAYSCPVCRLFGSTGQGNNGNNFPARLKVRDLKLTKASKKELLEIDTGLLYTEWKFENSIDRVTSAANPRNLERVPKGAKFEFSLIYDVEDTVTLQADLDNVKLAMRLLHDDSLGGHGSRGYGQVAMTFTKIEAKKIGYYKGEQSQNKLVGDIDKIIDLVGFFTEQN